ncbi:MAG: TraR/DksA C4-type zinc finger protein [Verrucomicrobiota bacterium]
MSPEEKETLRRRIEEELRGTRERIEGLEEATKPIAPDKGLGRLTRLEAMQDKSVNEAALERLRDDETRLENALGSIGRADFGVCVSCRQPIAFARMEAMPQSTLCVRCASGR